MNNIEHTLPDSLPIMGFGTGQLQGLIAREAVRAALREGYRLIDTGAAYGNEVEVGEALRQSNIPREKITVITKGAHDEHEHGYEQTLTAFSKSLGRLAVDYVDYYLIHWPTNPAQRRQTWRAMQTIQESGRARLIGVSNYAQHHLEELRDQRIQPVVNQLEFHPYIFSQQHDILDYCNQRGIRIIGYSTYANGQGDNDPVVVDIARRIDKKPRQVLARWSIQHGVAPLVRSSNPSRIAGNLEVSDFELSLADMDMLDSLQGDREFRDPHKML